MAPDLKAQNFPIFVVTGTGKRVIVMVNGYDTVERLKEKIQSKEGIPIDQQRLVFEGRQLEDGRCIDEYTISAESTIHICLRLKGC